MGLTNRNIVKTVTPIQPIQEIHNTPEDVPQISIKKEISLLFKTGYKFTVRVEDKKLSMVAYFGEKEAFFLDDIPDDFKKSLREILD